jgi:hypothetical protein
MLLEFCFSTLLMWCKGIIQRQQPMSMMNFESRFVTQEVMDGLAIAHINIG